MTSDLIAAPVKPLLRGHFHQAMFLILLGASVPLFLKLNNFQEKVSVTIYIACALFMFGVSTLYHRITWNPQQRSLMKKLDHAGIYLMIAGTFTPVAVLGLPMDSAVKLIFTIWATCVLGIIQSIFFINLPKLVSAVIYVVAGYLVLPYMSELKSSLGPTNIALIIAGGVFYTVGGLCYGLKRPMLNPKIFSYHEVFHIFVNLGAAAHFLVINSIIN